MKLPTDFVLIQRSDLAYLRSENARLTEQVRGAEGVLRKALREAESTASDSLPVMALRITREILRKGLSIYDEGTAAKP